MSDLWRLGPLGMARAMIRMYDVMDIDMSDYGERL